MAGSSTIPTGIDQSINPEQLGALAVRSACGRAAIGGVVWPARSRVGAETALLVLCMCLYGPAMLHVCPMHAICGYRGQRS